MAKETVDEIRRIEKLTEENEKAAKQEAEEILEKAKADAGRRIEEALTEEKNNSLAAEKQEKEKEDIMKRENLKKSEEEASGLRMDAASKIPQAVEALLESLSES